MSQKPPNRVIVYCPSRVINKFDKAWKSNNQRNRSKTLKELMELYVEFSNSVQAASELARRHGAGNE